MPNFTALKRTAIRFATAAIVLVVGLTGYAAFAEKRARRQADEFCATVQTRDPVAGLIDRARTAGADPRHLTWRPAQTDTGSPGPAVLLVAFTGASPLSRHICRIEAANERVISAGYGRMD